MRHNLISTFLRLINIKKQILWIINFKFQSLNLKLNHLIFSRHDTSIDSVWNSRETSLFSCACPLLLRRKKKFKVIVDVVRQSSFKSKYITRNSSFSSRCESRSCSARSSSLRSGDKCKFGIGAKGIRRSYSLRQATEMERQGREEVTRSDSFRTWNRAAAYISAREV